MQTKGGYATILMLISDALRRHKKQKIKSKIVKQKTQTNQYQFKKRYLLIALLVAVLLGGMSVPPVRASLQDRINKLQNENANKEAESAVLEEEATSLESKIDRLQGRINALQTEINTNEQKIKKLEVEIKKAEAELEKQRDLLGQNIRTMYVEGDISTLEMLASSKDLSEFVDKQQYRTSVQNKIKETLDRVNELKHQLNGQRETLQKRVDDRKRIQDDLNEDKAEQDQLLGLNAEERSDLDAQIRGNSKKIEELKRQQALENIRLFGGGGGTIGGGGYPWGYAKCLHTGQVDGWCPNYDWAVNGSIWNYSTGGYGYRNCTDYVAWRIRSQGRYLPSGLGNAKQWDDNQPSSSTPHVGDAAVSNSGFYGHVMYVEAVHGNGTITVSDYNRAGTGKYAVSTISAAGLSFVSF